MSDLIPVQKIKNNYNWLNIEEMPTDYRLDVCDFGAADSEFALKLIKGLAEAQALNLDILLNWDEDLDTETIETFPKYRLHQASRTLRNEANRAVIEEDSEGFAVGYPLIALPNMKGKLNIAPLLLWEVEFTEQANHKWQMIYKSTNPPILNQALHEFLHKEYSGFSLNQEVRKVLKDRRLSVGVLLEISTMLCKKLGLSGQTKSLQINPIPSNFTPKSFYWAGVLGVLPSLSPKKNIPLPTAAKEELAKSTEEALPLKTKPQEEKKTEPAPTGTELVKENIEVKEYQPISSMNWKMPVFASPLSAEQLEVFDTLMNTQSVLAVGESYSGKTHTIAAITMRAVASGGKCLVIAPHQRTAKDIGKYWYSFSLHDFVLDLQTHESELTKKQLFEELAKIGSFKKIPPYNDSSEQSLMKAIQRAELSLSKITETLNEPVFAELTRPELIGKYLNYQLQNGKHALNRRLKTTDYHLDAVEYDLIKEALAENQSLFAPIQSFQHPLEELFIGNFVEENPKTLELAILTELENGSHDFRKIAENYTLLIDQYADKWQKEYGLYAKSWKDKISQLYRDIKEYQEEYGDDFDKFGTIRDTRIKLLGVFSQRYQNISAAKDALRQQYEVLQKEIQENEAISYTFPTIRGSLTFAKIQKNIKEFEKYLSEWERTITTRLNENSLALHEKETKLNEEQKIAFIKNDELLAQAISRLNESKYFTRSFETKEKTYWGKANYALQIAAYLEGFQKNMPAFESFFAWKTHWLKLPENVKNILRTCHEVQPTDWTNAFNAWYLYQCLQKKYSADMPDKDASLKLYADQCKHLRSAIPAFVRNNVLVQQQKTAKAMRQTHIDLYRSLFSQDNQKRIGNHSLPKILSSDIEALSNVFPVWVVSPEQAREIFGNSLKTIFDIVLIDDAHELPVENTENWAKLGKYTAVFGKHPTEETKNSWAEWAKSQGFVAHELSPIRTNDQEIFMYDFHRETNGMNTFKQAIAKAMQPFIPSERIETNVMADGVLVDILIKPTYQGETPIAIMVDSFLRRVRSQSYESAWAAEEYLNQKGYKLLNTWSLLWFYQSDTALRQLVAAVLQIDQRYKDALLPKIEKS